MYIFVQKSAVPRTTTKISETDLDRLRTNIEKLLGRSVVQQPDCIALSDLIKEKTNQVISVQTLRRFFKLIKSESGTSLFTLNTLCQFCGFDDWKHFIDRNSKNGKIYSPGDQKGLSVQADIITSFFNFDQDEWKDNNFFRSVREIARRIYSNPSLASLLWEKLAKNPVAQRWIFEYSPDMGGLAGSFREGITSYLRYKKDHQACVYGHSLLFLGAFLSEDKKSLEKEFRIIDNLSLDEKIHCLPFARQLGTHLLYHFVYKNKTGQKKWMNLMTGKYLESFAYEAGDCLVFPGYHFMAANYLLVGNFHYEARQVLEEYMPTAKKIKRDHHSYDHLDILKLMYAMALAYDNSEEKAKLLLQQIQPEKISFIYKDYFMIHYLLLQLHFTGSAALMKKNKIKREIQKFIAATRYTYFDHQLKKYF